MKVKDDEVLLTPAETAELLKVKPGTLRNYSSVLPRRKIGRGVRYIRKLIVEAIDGCPPNEGFFDYCARQNYGSM